MKRILCFLFLAFACTLDVLSNERYHYTIDLRNSKDDRVTVTLLPPALNDDVIIFNIPKIVPGTYSISDFGAYISNFKAVDKQGQVLETEKIDVNRWRIHGVKKLQSITYEVDDTFDAMDKGDVVFEPAGTNIETNKNFLLNTFGFAGYFDGMKHLPFELKIEKPAGFYGSTSLRSTSSSDSVDTFHIANYMELADSPIMYNKPDTTVLKLGNTEILISVYNESGRVTSRPIADNLKELLEAQRRYLGGKLPVDKYAFLIYVPGKIGLSKAYGALEHMNSSVYFLPEMPAAKFSQQVRDIASHEFFHIVTPLNIHSEEIGDFDYIEPKMSKHLWLYEGVTEYFASHVQAYEKLLSPEQYLKKLDEYIRISKKQYNDTLAFTEMSAEVLTKHAEEYGNVYQKGALIGLVLDLKLRELSKGNYGVRNLMQDLSTTYGKNHSFKDDALFDKIAELTFPEIRTFFRRFVEGNEPLPLEDCLAKVGISYNAQEPLFMVAKPSKAQLKLRAAWMNP